MIGTPRDPAWQVWADRLQASGDIRGELITLELVPEVERDSAQTLRLAQLYRAHTERFQAHAEALMPGGWQVGRWRFGYALELSLTRTMQTVEQPSYSALFGAEELRGLTALELHLMPEQAEALVDALERHRPPLAGLKIHSDDDWRWTDFDEQQCGRLWAALPRLEYLALERTSFAHFNHTNSKALTVTAGSGSAGHAPLGLVEIAANSELPQLVRLNVYGIPYPLGSRHDVTQFWRDPLVVSLLERLEIFDCPGLLELLHVLDDPDRFPWEAWSHLRIRAEIFAGEMGLDPIVTERLPHLHFVAATPPDDFMWP